MKPRAKVLVIRAADRGEEEQFASRSKGLIIVNLRHFSVGNPLKFFLSQSKGRHRQTFQLASLAGASFRSFVPLTSKIVLSFFGSNLV